MTSTWPFVQIGEVLTPRRDSVRVRADESYQNFGIYSFGRGLFRKPDVSGATTRATVLFRATAGQIVYSRLFAFEGAYGLVPPEFDGYCVSNEFPLFDCDHTQVLPEFLANYLTRPQVWQQIAQSASGVGHRRQRVQPERFLAAQVPLPPLAEQRKILARIAEVSGQVRNALDLRERVRVDVDALLATAFSRIAGPAPRRPMEEVAPLQRRPIRVHLDGSYPQVAVRSFGRGTFHKPPLAGSDVTWQKPFLVKTGDILISNIKAWEGAIAVAGPQDEGRVGSHRYLTCVPMPGVATARFVSFYLLTPEGLHEIGEASPGSADRNRTLSSTRLMKIPVPVPPIQEQKRFDALCAEVDVLRNIQAETDAEFDALVPAVLDRAFKGEL